MTMASRASRRKAARTKRDSTYNTFNGACISIHDRATLNDKLARMQMGETVALLGKGASPEEIKATYERKVAAAQATADRSYSLMYGRGKQPMNGDRECARRVRQMAALSAKCGKSKAVALDPEKNIRL